MQKVPIIPHDTEADKEIERLQSIGKIPQQTKFEQAVLTLIFLAVVVLTFLEGMFN